MKKIYLAIFSIVFTFLLLELFTFIFFERITHIPFEYSKILNDKLDYEQDILSSLSDTIKKEKEFDKNREYIIHPYHGYTLYDSIEYFNSNDTSIFKIGILGGSVAGIFSNSNYLESSQKLSEFLGINKKIKIIELTEGGYKQPQQTIELLNNLIYGNKIDMVLNIDGFNELVMGVDNYNHNINVINPSYYHTLFIQSQINNSLSLKSMKIIGRKQIIMEQELKELQFSISMPYRYSFLLNAINLLKIANYKNQIIELNNQLKEELIVKSNTLNKGLNNIENPYKKAVDIWAKSSEFLNSICKNERIPYYHFLQPNQYYQGSKKFSKNEKNIAFTESDWSKIAKRGYPMLVKKGNELRSKGVPFYDLTMIFKKTNEDIYNDNCCHFNVKGNYIMGDEICNVILSGDIEN